MAAYCRFRGEQTVAASFHGMDGGKQVTTQRRFLNPWQGHIPLLKTLSTISATRKPAPMLRSRHLRVFWPQALLLWWLAWGGMAGPAVAEEAVRIVVHPDVDWGTGEASAGGYGSRSPLQAVFDMRLRVWPDGQPIRVFVLDDNHPVHRQFAKTVLSVFPYQLRRVWDQKVYSGTGQGPHQVATQQAMREAVSGTAGAVGYLAADRIDVSVRVLKVE